MKLAQEFSASIFIVFSVFYAIFVFEDFGSSTELRPIFIRFCVLAIFLGFLISGLRFNNHVDTAFKTALPVPFAAAVANIVLELAIVPAFAGAPNIFDNSDPSSVEFWMLPIFFVGASVVFAYIAKFGCAVGLGFRKGVERSLLGRRHQLITDNTMPQVALSDTDLKVARISATASIVIAVLGNLTVLISTYLM